MTQEQEREVKMSLGCLLQNKDLQFPQKAVIQCQVCPARSDDVGNLADVCHAAQGYPGV